jgi:2-iminobutanoate/2-iminopropanoate deaminase
MDDRIYINVAEARTLDGPWSHGVRAGPLVFTSGQVPVNPETGKVVDGGVREQVHQSLANIQAILQSAGATLGDIVKATVYLIDYRDFAAVNEAYAEKIGPSYPARTLITARELPVLHGRQVRVIIEAIAYVSGEKK